MAMQPVALDPIAQARLAFVTREKLSLAARLTLTEANLAHLRRERYEQWGKPRFPPR